jgi:hypothetical protein
MASTVSLFHPSNPKIRLASEIAYQPSMEDSSQPWASRVASLTRALEAAGIEFIDENGGGPSVRLGKRPQKKR